MFHSHLVVKLAATLLALAGPLAFAGPPALAAAAAAAEPAPTPCPSLAVGRPGASATPAPPALEQSRREVGGAALATSGLATPPEAPVPPKVTATSWLVADLTSGDVLGACGPHEYAVPASVQKLLLAAAVLPKLDPQQVVQVTREDLDYEPGSSSMGLVEGGRYTVETLWLGLLLNSGNDAANVLARLGGGTGDVRGGLAAMNAKAEELGAYQTHAATPSGLDGPGQYTSAYDLALIARACFAQEDFRRYAATRSAQVPAQPAQKAEGYEIFNDNQLLHRYPGALGGKTGFTDLARHTFVGAAERDGRTLLVTVLGAESNPARGWQQGAALLDWGFGLPADLSVGELTGPPGASVSAAPGLSAVAGGQGEPGEPAGFDRAGVLSLAGVAAAAVALVLVLTFRTRYPR